MKVFSLIVLILVISVLESEAYNIRILSPGGIPLRLQLGEGPYWDVDKQHLLLVDIVEQKVYRYIPSTDELFVVTLDGRVSPVVPVEGSSDKYLVGVEREFKILQWDGVSETPTSLNSIHSLNEDWSHRTNDGKCDPKGRMFIGTIDEGGSSGAFFYKLDTDVTVSQLFGGVGTSNGLAWSPDNTKMYYIDTPTRRVDVFDYELETGAISNRRPAFDLSWDGSLGGSPDGMTIDSQGNLWVATWGGSKILHIDPVQGVLIDTIDFTGMASQITSAAFGGPNLDVLYVTSAEAWGPGGESAPGSIFEVTGLGVTGLSGGVPYKGNV